MGRFFEPGPDPRAGGVFGFMLFPPCSLRSCFFQVTDFSAFSPARKTAGHDGPPFRSFSVVPIQRNSAPTPRFVPSAYPGRILVMSQLKRPPPPCLPFSGTSFLPMCSISCSGRVRAPRVLLVSPAFAPVERGDEAVPPALALLPFFPDGLFFVLAILPPRLKVKRPTSLPLPSSPHPCVCFASFSPLFVRYRPLVFPFFQIFRTRRSCYETGLERQDLRRPPPHSVFFSSPLGPDSPVGSPLLTVKFRFFLIMWTLFFHSPYRGVFFFFSPP